MTRQIEAGSIILSPREARMLYQAAQIGELRTRFRVGDTTLYRLLTDIATCAFTTPPNADDGNMARQETAKEESDTWTVNKLSKATGRATRTVRLDIERNTLPAAKVNTGWLITPTAAQTYINSHKN